MDGVLGLDSAAVSVAEAKAEQHTWMAG